MHHIKPFVSVLRHHFNAYRHRHLVLGYGAHMVAGFLVIGGGEALATGLVCVGSVHLFLVEYFSD